jgi:acid phosphatase family membrane protein YuiD
VDIVKILSDYSILMSACYSWFIAQFLKIAIELILRKKYKARDFILRVLFGTGGMPSSHSATVSAVTFSIGLKAGFDSPVFALAFVLMIIVIRDATGVRLSSGNQAGAINEILQERYDRNKIPFKKVKEVRGHTPLETFVGAFVGILVSLGLNLI